MHSRIARHLCACGLAVAALTVATIAATPSRMLLDFETPAQIGRLRPSEHVRVARTAAWASSGTHAARLTCRRGQPWTTFELDRHLLHDWEGFRYLAMDFHSERPEAVQLVVEFQDEETHNFASRSTFGERPKALAPVHRGVTHVRIDLALARRNRFGGLDDYQITPQHMIDFRRLTRVKIWFDTRRLDEDYVVDVDNIRLLPAATAEVGVHVRLPAAAHAFDFGGARPVTAGFTRLRADRRFAAGQTPGLVGDVAVREHDSDWPDPLSGSGIITAPTAHAPLEFRLEVAPGDYALWLCTSDFPRLNGRRLLKVNETTIEDLAMPPSVYYSTRGLYRFLDTPYSERQGALWHDVVARIAYARLLRVAAPDGILRIMAQDVALKAVVVVPAAAVEDLRRCAADLDRERQRCFYEGHYTVRPPNEPSSLTDPAAVLYAPVPAGVMPWSGAGPHDRQRVEVTAAPGETTRFPVAVRPSRDLGPAELQLTDLRTAVDAAPLDGQAAEIRLKRYLDTGKAVRPWCLTPTSRVALEKGLTRCFWLTLELPADAAAGVYTGAVVLTAGEVVRRLPVRLTVVPIRLLQAPPVAIGLYYMPPHKGQFVGYDQVAGFDAEKARILRQQMQLMRQCGLTAVQIPAPRIAAVKNGRAMLDFTLADKVVEAARRAGLSQGPAHPAVVNMLRVARRIATHLKGASIGIGEELTLPGFDPAYRRAAAEILSWAQRRELTLALWVVDEPREMPNPWNRNLADTMALCDLLETIPRARRMVTLMGDKNGTRDYTPLLDHLEIIATHATQRSARIIRRAVTDNDLDLWLFNAGKNRLRNGFYLWRSGAKGKHEWHFTQWVHGAHRRFYPGNDIHNPFLDYEFTGATVQAPLSCPGAVLPTEQLYTMARGISDCLYLYTLEAEIARARKVGGPTAAIADGAAAWLAERRRQIPLVPGAKRRPGELTDAELQARLGAWRRRVAVFISRLQRR